MAKGDKRRRDEKQELKPEMRDLILRFDAKDRCEENARSEPKVAATA